MCGPLCRAVRFRGAGSSHTHKTLTVSFDVVTLRQVNAADSKRGKGQIIVRGEEVRNANALVSFQLVGRGLLKV